LANIKSAAKRARQNIKRREENKRTKSLLKTAIRRFEESLEDGDPEEARFNLNAAVRQIDKATSKGVVHKNNAARKKSRLHRLYNQKAVG